MSNILVKHSEKLYSEYSPYICSPRTVYFINVDALPPLAPTCNPCVWRVYYQIAHVLHRGQYNLWQTPVGEI